MVGITEYAATSLANSCTSICRKSAPKCRRATRWRELESSKAVTPLVAPVAGVIRYVNNEAADDPSIVTGDPYGEGWIFKIELEDDEPGLLSSEEYANIVAQ